MGDASHSVNAGCLPALPYCHRNALSRNPPSPQLFSQSEPQLSQSFCDLELPSHLGVFFAHGGEICAHKVFLPQLSHTSRHLIMNGAWKSFQECFHSLQS